MTATVSDESEVALERGAAVDAATVRRTVPLIRVEGSGRQRGEAHGEQARDLVRESADRWADSFRPAIGLPLDSYLDELVERAGFFRAARRLTPELVDEVEGIAAGSGVDRRRIMALNLLD